jgi:cytoskeletal protein RodZ
MPSEPPSSLGSTTRTTETAAVSASQPTRPVKATEPEKKGSGALIAGVIGVLALIGVGVVVTRAPTPPPQTTTKIAVSAPPVVAEPPPPATTAASAAPAAQPPSDPAAVDINALSGAAEASAKPGFKVGGLLVKAAESAAPAATAVASAAPVVSAAPVPMGSVGALMDEMRKRVGSDGKTEETSQGPSGPAAKQDKPSGGAVLGAIGAVRGAVKACLADVDAVTRIGLVFASDGSVKSVSVSGGAAGKPAEGCVKAAAMKAHVAAFNDDSFSTSFSVRP